MNVRPASPLTSRYYAHMEAALERRIANLLFARHVPDSERVSVHVNGGTVVVSGRMSSLQAKLLCVECCRHVPGVFTLVDEVEV